MLAHLKKNPSAVFFLKLSIFNDFCEGKKIDCGQVIDPTDALEGPWKSRVKMDWTKSWLVGWHPLCIWSVEFMCRFFSQIECFIFFPQGADWDQTFRKVQNCKLLIFLFAFESYDNIWITSERVDHNYRFEFTCFNRSNSFPRCTSFTRVCPHPLIRDSLIHFKSLLVIRR